MYCVLLGGCFHSLESVYFFPVTFEFNYLGGISNETKLKNED